MSDSSTENITTLLRAWSAGDGDAFNDLSEAVYQELRRIAGRYMRRENPGHTLQTTALVNEVWTRLMQGKKVDWQDRKHFYAVASLAMRRILVDYARSRPHLAGGDAARQVALEEAAELSEDRAPELARLHEALAELEKIDARKCRIVELKFLVGLNVEEISDVLDVSARTVAREWDAAKVILHHLMSNAKSE
jgi:RNA polymerase sigma factor (TIGR02999 family)